MFHAKIKNQGVTATIEYIHVWTLDNGNLHFQVTTKEKRPYPLTIASCGKKNEIFIRLLNEEWNAQPDMTVVTITADGEFETLGGWEMVIGQVGDPRYGFSFVISRPTTDEENKRSQNVEWETEN